MLIDQQLIEATHAVLQRNVFSDFPQFHQPVSASKPETMPVETALRQIHQYLQSIKQEKGTSLLEPTSTRLISDRFMHRFYTIMDSELSNPFFRVEQLADELAVSHRTLTRKLMGLTGMSASQLMRSYRLQRAANFLLAGCSVSEAAEKTGFEGLSYFTRSFKAQFYVCPSLYRMGRYISN